MIELLLLSSTLGDASSLELDQGGDKAKTISQVELIVYIFVSTLAAYLSWTCNTKRFISPVMKTFYAFFAFLFGGLYLVMYAFMTSGYCCPPFLISESVQAYSSPPQPFVPAQ